MILDLSSLYAQKNAEEEIEVHLDMESFRSKLGIFSIIKKEPFRLHLANADDRRLLIQGELDVTVSIPCDRCLKEVPVTLHLVIDKDLPIDLPVKLPEKLLPGDSPMTKDDRTQLPAETDDDSLEQMEYRKGNRLDTDRLVYGEMLSVWPFKTLCRDDCRGICSKCGADLNETDCGCDRTVLDPRMAAFQDVFNKFKEV